MTTKDVLRLISYDDSKKIVCFCACMAIFGFLLFSFIDYGFFGSITGVDIVNKEKSGLLFVLSPLFACVFYQRISMKKWRIFLSVVALLLPVILSFLYVYKELNGLKLSADFNFDVILSALGAGFWIYTVSSVILLLVGVISIDGVAVVSIFELLEWEDSRKFIYICACFALLSLLLILCMNSEYSIAVVFGNMKIVIAFFLAPIVVSVLYRFVPNKISRIFLCFVVLFFPVYCLLTYVYSEREISGFGMNFHFDIFLKFIGERLWIYLTSSVVLLLIGIVSRDKLKNN